MLTFDSALLDPARRADVIDAALIAAGFAPADYADAVAELLAELDTAIPTAPDTIDQAFTGLGAVDAALLVRAVTAGETAVRTAVAVDPATPTDGTATTVNAVIPGGTTPLAFAALLAAMTNDRIPYVGIIGTDGLGLFTIPAAPAPRIVTDGVIATNTSLVSATAVFTPADVGKHVSGAGIFAGTTIASRTNATTVVLSHVTTATGAGRTITIGGAPWVPVPLNYGATVLFPLAELVGFGNNIAGTGGGPKVGDPASKIDLPKGLGDVVALTSVDGTKWAGDPPADVSSAINRMASLLVTLNTATPIP